MDVFNFKDLDGVDEYAIWGWAKWDYTPKKSNWHLLYRFSGLE